jgi:predicted secreted protein
MDGQETDRRNHVDAAGLTRMRWTSALAIYVLFWVMSAFLVMPFGVKTADELGTEKIPGQAESAPANFRPRRIIVLTTTLATVIFGLYYLNYVNGWITIDTINLAPYRG